MLHRWSDILLLQKGGAASTAGGADAGGTPIAAQGTDAQLLPAMCSALEQPGASPAASGALGAANPPAAIPAAIPAASTDQFTSIYEQAASAIAVTSRAQGGLAAAGPAAVCGGLAPEALGQHLVARVTLGLEQLPLPQECRTEVPPAVMALYDACAAATAKRSAPKAIGRLRTGSHDVIKTINGEAPMDLNGTQGGFRRLHPVRHYVPASGDGCGDWRGDSDAKGGGGNV